MSNALISQRLRALREELSLSQDDVAQALGLKDRQTVSAIETGDRKMKVGEVVQLIERYNLDQDYFTDPFRLVGEGAFNWRQTASAPAVLRAYQERAGRWLATYRELSAIEDRPGPAERRCLRLWENSSFEMAMAEGERITVDYNMGDVPAVRLPEVMEDDFGILVLMVDMDQHISGAACRLPDLDSVLVNRQENPGRRNFDLAHEFFHILTWDKMPPKEVEAATERGGSRIEQLANCFASALLMPRRLLERFGDWRRLGNNERAHRMREVADHFRVSVTALHWRLVGLQFLSRATAMLEVSPPMQAYLDDTPAAFSRSFLKVMACAIERGQISVARLSKLLEIPRFDLRDLFDAHGIEVARTV